MPNTVEFKDWLFVTLPEHTGEFTLRSTVHCDYASISFYNKWNNAETVVLIPKGSYQIIGKGDAIDWEGIVEKEELFINGVSQGMRYKDYKTEDVSEWFNRCKDSKKSLLRSLGMEPGTTLVLKKQTKLK